MTMRVRVEILTAGGDPPPAGSAVLVRVVDTALQDAPSTVMAETSGSVQQAAAGAPVAIAELDVPDQQGARPTIYVHIDVDGDGKVSAGDFITMQSYPCRGGQMQVEVRRV